MRPRADETTNNTLFEATSLSGALAGRRSLFLSFSLSPFWHAGLAVLPFPSAALACSSALSDVLPRASILTPRASTIHPPSSCVFHFRLWLWLWLWVAVCGCGTSRARWLAGVPSHSSRARWLAGVPSRSSRARCLLRSHWGTRPQRNSRPLADKNTNEACFKATVERSHTAHVLAATEQEVNR